MPRPREDPDYVKRSVNITVNPEVDDWVGSLVDAGRFRSRSQAYEEGARLLMEREELEAEVRAEVAARHAKIQARRAKTAVRK